MDLAINLRSRLGERDLQRMDDEGRQSCCGQGVKSGGGIANAAMPPGMNLGQSRRSMLSWLLGSSVAASLASFFYPVIRFLNPPHISEATVDEVSGGKVGDLKLNSGKIVKFGNKPALLVRISDTEWKAFSAVCTHLNCTVQYQSETRLIWCACHNGMYDLTGRVVSGPPPKPLDEFAVRVRGDEVVISRRA